MQQNDEKKLGISFDTKKYILRFLFKLCFYFEHQSKISTITFEFRYGNYVHIGICIDLIEFLTLIEHQSPKMLT